MILTPEAIRIATDRYFTPLEKQTLKDRGEDEAFGQMCARVARAIATVESSNFDVWYTRFYAALHSLKFVPGGRFWSNTGTEVQQLFNCDIMSPKDDLGHIYDTLKNWGFAHGNGAGVGGNFGKLRHRGARVGGGKKEACGPCAVIRMYDAEADLSHSSGSRRAACMGSLPVDHPDILEFIMMKGKSNRTLSRFNLSGSITHEFMKALEETPEAPWYVRDHKGQNKCICIPKLEGKTRVEAMVSGYMLREIYDLDESLKSNFMIVTPSDIWSLLVERAWDCGDPGLIFIDTINETNSLIKDVDDRENEWYIHSTNPCGELPLAENEICMLGSVNLSQFVSDGTSSDGMDAGVILWDDLAKIVSIGVRFLDNGIAVSSYPLRLNKEAIRATRRIGLGVMGWHDMLIKLKIVYGSDESLELAEKVMGFINDEALKYSIHLGKEKGNFPLFEKSAYADGRNGFPIVPTLRNAFRTTVAPTGTTSILAGTSSAIEPVFMFELTRKDGTGERVVRHPLWQTQVDKQQGRIGEAPTWFVSAMDIPVEQHIKMQIAFQKYVNNSISKTINLPSTATQKEVQTAFMMAYKGKCKGITVYRDTSKEEQVLNKIEKVTEEKSTRVDEIHVKIDRLLEKSGVGASSRIERERREGKLDGSTYKVHTGDGTLFLTINANGDGLPFETFATIGKAGSDVIAFTDAISRLTSLALQYKIPVDQITKQLIGISGAKPIFHTIGEYHRILSIPDAIGKVLETHMKSLPIPTKMSKEEEVELKRVFEPLQDGREKVWDPDGSITTTFKPTISSLDQVIGPLRGPIASEVQRELFQIDPLPKVNRVAYNLNICNKCSQEVRVVRGCRICGCGSTCE